jgi:hypothetical protein
MDNPTKLALVSEVLNNINNTQYINGSGTAVSGLNIYQIYPKKLIYPLSGYSSAAATNSMIGAGAPGDLFSGFSTNLVLNADSFIVYSNQLILRLFTNADVFLGVDIEYVDISGNYKTNSIIVNQGYTFNFIYNINSIKWSDSESNLALTQLAVCHAEPSGGLPYIARNSINTYNCGSAVITVPNGYRGLVTEFYIYKATVLTDIKMYVRDFKNNIKTIQYFPSMSRFDDRYNYMGTLNYPLDPLDTVYFSCQQGNAGDRFIHANVVMTAF